MIDIQSLKMSVSLLDLIPDLKKSTGDYRSACPIHSGHDRTAFSVSLDGQYWKCWSGDCGGGDVISFVMARDNVDFKRAIDILGGGKDISPDELLKIAQERETKAAQELADKRREYAAALHDLQNARDWERWHDEMTDASRQEWRRRGISDTMQDYYKFGYCPSFNYSFSNMSYSTPALSIPVYAPNWELVTVRMRLLNPVDEKSKYRPIRNGLHSSPFLADPDLGYENASRTIVVEGEIKAAVVYQTWDKALCQVIGVPGKDQKKMISELSERLKGQDVWVCFDPDALKQAVDFARKMGGAKVVKFDKKIDDAINQHELKSDWIEGLLKVGKYVK